MKIFKKVVSGMLVAMLFQGSMVSASASSEQKATSPSAFD